MPFQYVNLQRGYENWQVYQQEGIFLIWDQTQLPNLKGNAWEAVGGIDLWIMGLRVKVVYLVFCHSSGRSDWKEETML